MAKVIPPRLHALLARDASTAVVIRRGPSRCVAVVGWDRSKNDFAVGQWFYGRIYERRCDLSPDGRYLLYFAMNGRWGSEVLGSWPAVSRAPYIKALGLWPKGDCWNGGGLFTSNDTFWLNDGPFGHRTMREAPGLKHQEKFPWPDGYGGECPGVYYIRLQRDGWQLLAAMKRHDNALWEREAGLGWLLGSGERSSFSFLWRRGYLESHSRKVQALGARARLLLLVAMTGWGAFLVLLMIFATLDSSVQTPRG